MVLTAVQVQKILQKDLGFATQYTAAINHTIAKYGINTPKRVAAFLAQLVHESKDLTKFEESLYYSAQRLMEVWPARFGNLAIANQYAKNPQKLANKVYGGRLGNGPEASGDGWKFRGAGAIQLTGRSNHTAYGKTLGMTAEATAEFCKTPAGAIDSAGWFWLTNGLSTLADQGKIDAVSVKVNGGGIGLVERRNNYNRILPIVT